MQHSVFVKYVTNNWSCDDAVMFCGLAGEAGEVQELLCSRALHHRNDLLLELGDVLHYLVAVIDRFDVNANAVFGCAQSYTHFENRGVTDPCEALPVFVGRVLETCKKELRAKDPAFKAPANFKNKLYFRTAHVIKIIREIAELHDFTLEAVMAANVAKLDKRHGRAIVELPPIDDVGSGP